MQNQKISTLLSNRVNNVITSLEIVTVLPPPPYYKKGNSKGGKTVTLCPKSQKISAPSAPISPKNNRFYTSCWTSTAGGEIFFELFAPFCDDFALKNVDFPMQNAESKYQIPKIFACGAMVLIELPFYPPCSKIGKNKGGVKRQGGVKR